MKTVRNTGVSSTTDLQTAYPHWRSIISVATALADFAVVFGTTIAVSISYHWFSVGHIGNVSVMLQLALTLSFIFVFTNVLEKRYRLTKYLTINGQILAAFNVWNIAMFAFAAVAFMTKVIDNYSRAVIVLTYIFGTVLVPLTRYVLVKVISIAAKTGRVAAQHVLLVGLNKNIMSFMTRHQPWNSGLVVREMLVLQDEPIILSENPTEMSDAAELSYAIARARETKPDAIILALPWSDQQRIDRCVEAFMTVPVTISLAPEAILDRFESPRISRIGSVCILELQPAPFTSLDLVAKRVTDFAFALAGLVMLFPVFLAIACLIKLSSKGPVFFYQRRYGFNQEPFRIVKFRTMTTMDDGDVVDQATSNDQRITPIGNWLRRWNIDELPQLLNVVQGRMSLVGPRPHALAHNREYENKIALYARRHNVKPGITGWAQVNGFRGLTDTDDKMARRVDYDLWYIDNWSYWLDWAILFRTVFSRKAYLNAV